MALFRAVESARTHGKLFDDRFAPRFLSGGLALAARAAQFSLGNRAIASFIDRRRPGRVKHSCMR